MNEIVIPNDIKSGLKTMYETIADNNGYSSDSAMDKETFGRKVFLRSQTPDAILLFMPSGITKDDVYRLVAEAKGYSPTVEDEVIKTETVEQDDDKIYSPNVISIEDVIVDGKEMVTVTYTDLVTIPNPIDYNYFSRLELGNILKNWIAEVKKSIVEKNLAEYRDKLSNEVPDLSHGARIF